MAKQTAWLKDLTPLFLVGAGTYLLLKSDFFARIGQGIGDIGSGLGSGFSGIGQGFGNFESGVGGGVYQLGSGLEHIGGGAGNLLTGISPSNIIDATQGTYTNPYGQQTVQNQTGSFSNNSTIQQVPISSSGGVKAFLNNFLAHPLGVFTPSGVSSSIKNVLSFVENQQPNYAQATQTPATASTQKNSAITSSSKTVSTSLKGGSTSVLFPISSTVNKQMSIKPSSNAVLNLLSSGGTKTISGFRF